MWNLIHNLQQRPKRERKRILLLSAGSITAVIAVIWFFTFYINVLTHPQTISTAETSPLSSLKKDLSNVYQSISDIIPTSTPSVETSTTSTTSTSTTSSSSSPKSL